MRTTRVDCKSTNATVSVLGDSFISIALFGWRRWSANCPGSLEDAESICGLPTNSAGTSGTKSCEPPRFGMPPADVVQLRHMLDAALEAATFAKDRTGEHLRGDRVLT